MPQPFRASPTETQARDGEVSADAASWEACRARSRENRGTEGSGSVSINDLRQRRGKKANVHVQKNTRPSTCALL